MITIKNINDQPYFFKYNLESSRIIEVSPELKSQLASLNCSIDDVVIQLKSYFQIKRSVVTDINGSKFEWLFAVNEKEVVAFCVSKKNVATSEKSESLHSRHLQLLGEMTGGIVHDINNPLGYIVSSYESLRYYINELKDDSLLENEQYSYLMKKLEYIEEGSSSIAEIIEAVKILIHKQEADFKEENIIAIIEKSISIISYKLKKKKISIKIKNREKKDFYLKCKKTLIFQMIMNLIQNSADAIENLPVFNRWIEIDVSEDNGKIFVLVRDGGNGFPEEISEKVFDSFFTTKEVGKGTGLGLSLAKQIMDSHDGDISIDRTDKNTCLRLIFNK